MKSSFFSILLFIILVAFLTYADISFKNLCNDIIEMCDELEDTMKAQSKEENFETAMKIFNLLQDRGNIASIYINHMDYDVMLTEALKLTVYIENDDISESEASLHSLKFNTMHMKELQIPDFKNIF